MSDWEKSHLKPRVGGGGTKGRGGGGGRGGSGQGDGVGFRAALLSGPPGVGKTTTAVLACEVSFDHFIGHVMYHMTGSIVM